MSDFEYYGKILTGDETELEKTQLARTKYLKDKMRTHMLPYLGDTDDNIADLTRAITLGIAIQNGVVTDTDIIERYDTYINDMLAGYGGADNIMTVLENDKSTINDYVINGYYSAKMDIYECTDIDSVRKIDLPWEPSTEEI